MRTTRLLFLAPLAAVALLAQPSAATTPQGGEPMFRFTTDGFWLNLHHFLYVLGRAEAGRPDSTRDAVAGAPAEAARGLAGASPQEGRAWNRAVTAYARRLSLLDPVFDASLSSLTNALRRAGDGPIAAAGDDVPEEVRRTLDAAAPVYRRAFWPAHRAANEAWVARTQPLVDRHGRDVRDFITRAYALSWPPGGYPVQVSAYANWAGAYSTAGDLLVVGSLDAGQTGTLALEIVVHEAMHQWDVQMGRALRSAGRSAGVTVSDDLSHALIFYTAGEAVRRAAPGHVPVAEVGGIWSRSLGRFRAALQAAWQPWLDGRGTRDEALADLVRRVAGGTAPAGP